MFYFLFTFLLLLCTAFYYILHLSFSFFFLLLSFLISPLVILSFLSPSFFLSFFFLRSFFCHILFPFFFFCSFLVTISIFCRFISLLFPLLILHFYKISIFVFAYFPYCLITSPFHFAARLGGIDVSDKQQILSPQVDLTNYE